MSSASTGEVTIATKVVWDKACIAFCSVSVEGFCIVLIKRGILGATSSFDSKVVSDVMVFNACLPTYRHCQPHSKQILKGFDIPQPSSHASLTPLLESDQPVFSP